MPGTRTCAGRQPGVQRRAGTREQLATAHQIQYVVGVATVGQTATRRNQPAAAQLTQVIGDQALGLARQLAQLADPPIAAR